MPIAASMDDKAKIKQAILVSASFAMSLNLRPKALSPIQTRR